MSNTAIAIYSCALCKLPCTFHPFDIFLYFMKYIILSLVALAGLAVATPQAEAASSMFEYRPHIYTYNYNDGWPKWIGRLHEIAYRQYLRPELSTKYLPLSLVRTGGFEAIVNEVSGTPNVDTTNWPEWIGDNQ